MWNLLLIKFSPLLWKQPDAAESTVSSLELGMLSKKKQLMWVSVGSILSFLFWFSSKWYHKYIQSKEVYANICSYNLLGLSISLFGDLSWETTAQLESPPSCSKAVSAPAECYFRKERTKLIFEVLLDLSDSNLSLDFAELHSRKQISPEEAVEKQNPSFWSVFIFLEFEIFLTAFSCLHLPRFFFSVLTFAWM